jgi:hypothetical protein
MPSDFKKQVVELLKRLETGDRSPLATINPNKYIQHNLRVADGLGDFASGWNLFPRALPRSIPFVPSKMATLSLPIRRSLN